MGSPGIIKSPVFNMAFLLVTMQLSKRIDWENPDTLLYARVSYYGAQVLVCLLTFALMQLVKKRNGKCKWNRKERGVVSECSTGLTLCSVCLYG